MNHSQHNKFQLPAATFSGAIRPMVVLSLLVMAGCVSIPQTPQTLQVPADQKILLHAYAKGVQIYGCQPSSADPHLFVWALKAPEAMLFDELGNVIGSHYAGPTWESDLDGSTVRGEVLRRSPAPDANAIPWLLLQAKPGDAAGLFQRVSYIQRLNTTGGKAPVTGADAAHLGQEVRVHFTAEYIFYRPAHAPATAKRVGATGADLATRSQ